jgi:hypothetical protein
MSIDDSQHSSFLEWLQARNSVLLGMTPEGRWRSARNHSDDSSWTLQISMGYESSKEVFEIDYSARRVGLYILQFCSEKISHSTVIAFLWIDGICHLACCQLLYFEELQ